MPANFSNIIVKNASSVEMIWDISNLQEVKNIIFQKTADTLSFNILLDSLKHFIAVSGNNFPYPKFEKQVQTQNLHAFNDVDMMIVSPQEFLSAAQELKSIHQTDGS